MSSTLALEKQNHMQYGFAAFIAAVSFVTCAALPPFTFLLLASSTASLLLYHQQWLNITLQHPTVEIDKSSITMISAAILIGGFLFLPLDLISKMLLCSLAGAGIGYFFANQCVLKSQTSLNENLREAAKSSNIDEVNHLLKLGADPFAPDALGNCAFHHSIQNHPNSTLVLKALHQNSKKTDYNFNNVFAATKNVLFDKNIRNQWVLWAQSLKACFSENNAKNRVLASQAFVRIFEAYIPVLKHCLKKLTRYLRDKASYPKNLNCINLRGNTALDILNGMNIEQTTQQSLKETLTQCGIKIGNPIKVTQTFDAPNSAQIKKSVPLASQPAVEENILKKFKTRNV